MNFNNIIKLLKAYFYENWQNDVIYNFIIVMAISLINMLMSPFDINIAYFAAAVLIVIYPCRLFAKLHNPSSRMHYLMIPANNAEKVVTGMLLSNIYFVIGIALSVTIGLLIGFAITKVINPDTSINLNSICNLLPFSALNILTLFTCISTTFFAAIYFKKSPFWKLLLTGFIVSTVYSAILAATVWLNIKSVIPAGSWPNSYIRTESYVTVGSDLFSYFACCLYIVFFYAMSFLRMRETEA